MYRQQLYMYFCHAHVYITVKCISAPRIEVTNVYTKMSCFIIAMFSISRHRLTSKIIYSYTDAHIHTPAHKKIRQAYVGVHQ